MQDLPCLQGPRVRGLETWSSAAWPSVPGQAVGQASCFHNEKSDVECPGHPKGGTWEKGIRILRQDFQSPVTPGPGQMAKVTKVGQVGL